MTLLFAVKKKQAPAGVSEIKVLTADGSLVGEWGN